MSTSMDPSPTCHTLSNRNTETVENSILVYELYTELYSRYISIQNTDGALNTLHEGIIFFLDMDQISSATSLSMIFARTLLSEHIAPSTVIFVYIQEIFKKFGQPLAAEREYMLIKVIQWTIIMCPQYPLGHPSLHGYIGYVYWSEYNYFYAQHHYLRSSDGLGFACMLVELHITRGFKHEVDLFIAQVVLQGLCLRNKIIAESTLKSYTKLHPAINDKPPYSLPLLNFIYFLLKILDSGQTEPFITLCEQYRSTLIRDPSYTEYLDKIWHLFFLHEPIGLSNPTQP